MVVIISCHYIFLKYVMLFIITVVTDPMTFNPCII